MTNLLDIANTFASFYAQLYNFQESESTTPPNLEKIESFLSSIHLPSLSPTQLTALSTPFTPDEVYKAIKSLPLHKALGLDGFSNEYYKHLNDNLSPHLCITFTQYASTKKIPKESLEA